MNEDDGTLRMVDNVVDTIELAQIDDDAVVVAVVDYVVERQMEPIRLSATTEYIQRF